MSFLFGGSKKPSPPPPPPPPEPSSTTSASKKATKKKIRKGMSDKSTILTSPLGATSEAQTRGKTLLGA